MDDNKYIWFICGILFCFLIIILILSKSCGWEEARNKRVNHWVSQAVAYSDPCELRDVVCKEETYSVEEIIASWYNYDLDGLPNYGATHLTAASRTIPRRSRVTVTNLANGKSVEVVINDYGPKEWTGRGIDLSQYAFSQIADLRQGIIRVSIN